MGHTASRLGATEVRVFSLPDCDFCKEAGIARKAAYDGKTIYGPWANMCDDDFEQVGVGLGLGRGQRLVLRK